MGGGHPAGKPGLSGAQTPTYPEKSQRS